MTTVNNARPNIDKLKSSSLSAKTDTTMLTSDDTIDLLAREIGKTLFDFLLKSDEDLSTTMPLSQLGMDLLVSVEMRKWWRQVFGCDVSMLELLGMSNLEELGKRAAKGLIGSWEWELLLGVAEDRMTIEEILSLKPKASDVL